MYTIKTNVLPGAAYNTILSTDYLQKINICLDFRTRCIIFNNQVVREAKSSEFLPDAILVKQSCNAEAATKNELKIKLIIQCQKL